MTQTSQDAAERLRLPRDRPRGTGALAPTDTGPMMAGRVGLLHHDVVWIALAIAAIVLIWALSDIVMVVLLAALLAVVLRGSADWLARRTRLPARLMLATITVLIIMGGAGLCFWIGPKLVRQGQELTVRLVSEIATLRANLGQTPLGEPLSHALSATGGPGPQLLGPAKTVLVMTFRTLAGLVILIVTALYFAVSPQVYVRGLVRLFPIPRRPRALEVMGDTAGALRRWLLGQLVDMLTVGVLAAVGLTLAGIPDPFALALIAGLFTFIPYFGAIIAAIPALIVSLTVGMDAALWTAVVYLACHAVEAYVVAPLVQRRLLDLPPALSILSMTVAGTLFGPLGVILGTPLAAAGLVVVRELYLADTLGDRDGAA